MHTRRTFLRTSLGAFLADAFVGHAGAESSGALAEAASTEPVTYFVPGDTGYHGAREVYNAGVRISPNVIARCSTEAGVQQALQRAAELHYPVAVKSGGHSFEGFSLNDDGLVVDVSPMRELRLEDGILTAGAGCTLAEVNQFLLAKGRFLPSGSCGSVGLAGLTLGGGYGMFARKWGLTCDHLRSVRMVDGTGKIRDSRDEPDLLWACRGGGNGHFGVVTQLTLQTRVAPASFSAWKFRMFKLDVAGAIRVMEAWFEATPALPREAFSAWIMNGSQVTILLTSTGSGEQKGVAAFRKKLGALSNKATSSAPTSLLRSMPWYYGNPGPIFFKNSSAGYYKGIEDIRTALPAIFDEVLEVPGLVFQVNTLGGAIADSKEGVYPHRSYPYLGERQAYWDHVLQGRSRGAAVGRIGAHLEKAGVSRHYANYPDLAFKDWPTAYYGEENYARLQKLKRIYDPDNRIQHPQSVRLAE